MRRGRSGCKQTMPLGVPRAHELRAWIEVQRPQDPDDALDAVTSPSWRQASLDMPEGFHAKVEPRALPRWTACGEKARTTPPVQEFYRIWWRDDALDSACTGEETLQWQGRLYRFVDPPQHFGRWCTGLIVA